MSDKEKLVELPCNASSNLVPSLFGKVIRWIDDFQFVVCCNGREILGDKRYWRITSDV